MLAGLLGLDVEQLEAQDQDCPVVEHMSRAYLVAVFEVSRS